MSQRAGRAAQDEFKLFCSRAGITCNSSSEDDHGWDFSIEIEPNRDAKAPADKQIGIRKAFGNRGNFPGIGSSLTGYSGTFGGFSR